MYRALSVESQVGFEVGIGSARIRAHTFQLRL
jgi:hypothetical protein